MDKRRAEWLLLMTWGVGAIVVFVVLLIQHMGGAFGSDASRAWGWYTATALPALSLLTGSFIADGGRNEQIDKAAFKFVLAVSLFYLVILVLASMRYAFQSSHTALDVLADSSVFLGPVQGLVSLSLGRLFGAAKATSGT